MPELDGYEVARQIRRTSAGREALLIALTGWGQTADKERALAAGFDHHFTKPVAPDQLQRLLQREFHSA
jgi:CheY-like chemotaxis protein